MRDILVHAIRHRDWSPGVVHAARVAASMRAALTALYVPAGMPVLPVYDPNVVLDAYAQWLEREAREARASGPAFQAWASSLGVSHPTWLVADGDVGALLRYVGSWHDLLVLDAGGDDPWAGPAGIATHLIGSGLPCLVVPQSAPDTGVPHACIAIAWNGSMEAIRAVHAALPLLQRASRIVVLSGQSRTGRRWLPAFQLDGWCERHGLRTEHLPLGEGADDGDSILDAARTLGADLLVMGAYGRSRLSEWILGGVTLHMLRNSSIPLLMRH